MLDLAHLPKELEISDGRIITIRVLEGKDENDLYKFLCDLPQGERVYFRDDVTERKVVTEWVKNTDFQRVFPLLACDGDKIVANWSMHMREHGWTRHLANIRGIVKPDYRGFGIAAQMVYELLGIAGQVDIERVVIELVSPQARVLELYKGLGFTVEAVLKQWVKDFKGKYHDQYILTMQLEPAWKKMEDMILNYGTHGG
ncbi:GNAT family N-acetyltransferase [Calditrichota bacterium]